MENSESESYLVSESESESRREERRKRERKTNIIIESIRNKELELEREREIYAFNICAQQENIYDMDYYHNIEAVRNYLYITMAKLAINVIYNKHELFYKQFINVDVGKEREIFYYMTMGMDGRFGCSDDKIINEMKIYIKLLLTYDKYNKLNLLKNKTKLNNDIIFDIIIKYL